jgi:nitroimidazol reductase NimA-like FMN-containing flavoprotein (pyridoxamine 5'-phosphate oxidase superfamily)
MDQWSAILSQAEVGHLGMVDDEGVYVVPLSFAHEVRGADAVTIYVHGAGAGRKVSAITAHPERRVCFEAEVRHATTGLGSDKVCDVGVWFESVIGWGQARLVTDPAEARRGLVAVAEKYAPGRGGQVPDPVPAWVTMLAFDLDELTGKRREPVG